MSWLEPVIYVVDDDPVFRKFMETHIMSNGFKKLKSFDSGEAFLSSLKENPDVVLLDFSLKGINGMDVLKQIKQSGASIQVVVITILNDKELEAKCLENGAAEYLVKEESRMDAVKTRVLDILLEARKKKRVKAIIGGIVSLAVIALLYFIFTMIK